MTQKRKKKESAVRPPHGRRKTSKKLEKNLVVVFRPTNPIRRASPANITRLRFTSKSRSAPAVLHSQSACRVKRVPHAPHDLSFGGRASRARGGHASLPPALAPSPAGARAASRPIPRPATATGRVLAGRRSGERIDGCHHQHVMNFMCFQSAIARSFHFSMSCMMNVRDAHRTAHHRPSRQLW